MDENASQNIKRKWKFSIRTIIWTAIVACVFFGNFPWFFPMRAGSIETHIAGFPLCYTIYQFNLETNHQSQWNSPFALFVDVTGFILLVFFVTYQWRRMPGASKWRRWSIQEILVATLLTGSFITWDRERHPHGGNGVDDLPKIINSRFYTWLPPSISKFDRIARFGSVSIVHSQSLTPDTKDLPENTSQLRWVSEMTISSFDDDDFANLKSRTLLASIYLKNCNVGPRAAAWLSSLPNLGELRLRNCSLRETPIRKISNFRSLHTLSLDSCAIPASFWKEFGTVSSLRKLEFRNGLLRDSQGLWAGLRGHPNLEKLVVETISNSRPHEMELVALPKLRSLEVPFEKQDQLRLNSLPALEELYTSQGAGRDIENLEIKDCPVLELYADVSLQRKPRLRVVGVRKLTLAVDCYSSFDSLNEYYDSLKSLAGTVHFYSLNLERDRSGFESVSILPKSEILAELVELDINGSLTEQQLQEILLASPNLTKLRVGGRSAKIELKHSQLETFTYRFHREEASIDCCEINLVACPKLVQFDLRAISDSDKSLPQPFHFAVGLIHAPMPLQIDSSYRVIFNHLQGEVRVENIKIGERLDVGSSPLTIHGLGTLSFDKTSEKAIRNFFKGANLGSIKQLRFHRVTLPDFSGESQVSPEELIVEHVEFDLRNLDRLIDGDTVPDRWIFHNCNFLGSLESNRLTNANQTRREISALIFTDCKIDESTAIWLSGNVKARSLALYDTTGDLKKILQILVQTTSMDDFPKLHVAVLSDELIQALEQIPETISIFVVASPTGELQAMVEKCELRIPQHQIQITKPTWHTR